MTFGAIVAGNMCEKAIEVAVQKLVKEAILVVNFRQDFEWLNDKLTYLRGFLTDAGEGSKQKKAVEKWLQKIEDIAMQSEDIVEECAVESMYGNSIPSFGSSWNQIKFRRRMGKKIKDVKDKISSIIQDGQLLQIAHVVSQAPASSNTFQRADWKRSSLLPIDSHPVGIESKVEYMVSLLDNSPVPVIAVVGMGGLGKTYLLQHVYNKTKERFDKSIWLSISQSYSISKLQHDIACDLDLRKEIVEGDVSEQHAAQLIYAKLEGKKSLIVLDDVWKPIVDDNLIERLGLTMGHNSTIVITTRNRGVCRNVEAQIYELEKLSEEDSWKLFCAYSFPNCAENRPPREVEEVARIILRECGNLPLAIKTTAASVAGFTLRREWDLKLRQLKEVSDLNNPMEILKLSYDCLPASLKACFAYFSFFPEDEKIECERLINLWIGEGFIPERQDQLDIGWSYLYEMANLCLAEVWEEWERVFYSYELKKYCRVHDMLLDLAIYISKQNKCAFDVDHAFTRGPSMETSGGLYRILLPKKSVSGDVMAHSRPAGSPSLLRTLSLSNNGINNIGAKMFVNMRGLRVLDLSWNDISTLPDCVGEMKLLNILNLANTNIMKLPRCVRRLKSLSFLDVSGCRYLKQLPVWIDELKCLQQINFLAGANYMPKEIAKLQYLRILRAVVHFQNDKGLLKLEGVGTMTQLQELYIYVDNESDWKSIEGGILGRLVNMRHFRIHNVHRDERWDLLSFPENMKAMADLESLYLRGLAVTSCLCSFANLRELTLTEFEFERSNYPEFENMGNLVSLELVENRTCRELPKAFGKSLGFPKLRFLHIQRFTKLEEFPELEDGAMPCLEMFKLCYCERVMKVPEGLEALRRLKEFDCSLTGSEEMRERLKEGSQDWHKIKARNPTVIITT